MDTQFAVVKKPGKHEILLQNQTVEEAAIEQLAEEIGEQVLFT